MNAVTKAEVHVIETAAPLEAADPTKNLILVALSQLQPRRSKHNARTTPRLSIPELAASISRVGLLQNLVVILAADGERYEVVAGDRRLTAMKLLAKKKHIPADYEVPCLLVPDASARTVSLAENLLREQMHPADQFEAFAALVKEGRPIEDIAADFGVSPLVVQRRLKLANVSPCLLADYRAGGVTLEQLMALTIIDDHAAQEAAFYAAPEWQRGASALRERLTEREISAGHSLVRAKLDAQAEEVRAEGWAWVEAVLQMSHADRQTFQNAPRQRREPSAREARRIASLQGRLDKIDTTLEEAYDAEDEDKVATLEERREQVAGELQAIEDALQDYAPDVRAVAGAIVTIDREGETVIYRGLLREAEAKALRTLHRLRQGFAEGGATNEDEGGADEAPKAANVSDRLAQRLSAHRTAALQIEVAQHPHVALAALVHGMVQTVLQPNAYRDGLPLGVRLTVKDRLESLAPDVSESSAAVALRALQEVAGEALPQDSAELFAVLLAKSQDELVRLLAVCVAATVDVVTPRAAQRQPGAELAQAVGLDMAAWWKPTAEGYFQHVPKAAILEAVGQYAPEHVTRLSKLKKGDIASEAELLAEGSGWMPAVFQTGHHTEPEGVPDAVSDDDAPEDTADEAEADVLAA